LYVGAAPGRLSPEAEKRLEGADQSLASLQKIAALLEERKAQLGINHDKPRAIR
jgi:hypothetical protein